MEPDRSSRVVEATFIVTRIAPNSCRPSPIRPPSELVLTVTGKLIEILEMKRFSIQLHVLQFTARTALWCTLLLAMVALSLSNSAAQERESKADDKIEQDSVYSGPQIGEPLVEFEYRKLFTEEPTKVNLVKQAGDEVVVLIFVHKITRPSVRLTNEVTQYALSLKEKGVHTGVVLLSRDPTDTVNWANRARNALPTKSEFGIFEEGEEGPGSYGLNRNVELTVLVGKEQEVTANFALIQSSLETDGRKIVDAIATAAGVEPPAKDAWPAGNQGRRPNAQMDDGQFRTLMVPLLNKEADQEAIDRIAKGIEAEAEKNEALKKRLGEVARRIIEADRLSNYGNEFAQGYLKKWAEAY